MRRYNILTSVFWFVLSKYQGALARQLQLKKILSHVVLLSPQSYTQAHTDLQVGQSNFSLHSHTPIMAGEAIGVNTRILEVRGGIFKLLWSPEIDSEESIPTAYVALRAVREPYS